MFYDKLERARRQTTARLGMLASLAGMGQQLLTLLSLLSAVIFFSPWLLVLLTAATIPVFLGETRFAMLNYSMLLPVYAGAAGVGLSAVSGRQQRERQRESRSSALGNYLVERSRALFERFYAENRHLAIRRALHGIAPEPDPDRRLLRGLRLILVRALAGLLTVGDLTLMVGRLLPRPEHHGEPGVRIGRHFRTSAYSSRICSISSRPNPALFRAPNRASRATADPRWIRVSRSLVRLSGLGS